RTRRTAGRPAPPWPPSWGLLPGPRRWRSPRPAPPGARAKRPPLRAPAQRSSHALLAAPLAAALRGREHVVRGDRGLLLGSGGPARQRHESLLAAQRRVGPGLHALVDAVGAEQARLDVVGQRGAQHFVDEAVAQGGVLDGEGDLHAAEEVALHP